MSLEQFQVSTQNTSETAVLNFDDFKQVLWSDDTDTIMDEFWGECTETFATQSSEANK